MPFKQYIKQRLFRPLGMHNSTVDSDEILSNPSRAIGQMIVGIAKVPPIWSMIGAGLVYTSAADLARFVQLHINKGTLEGKRLLDGSLLDAMYTPHGFSGTTEQPDGYYGLGIVIDRRKPRRVDLLLYHGGGGFGFSTFMHWYPEYCIGAVALTNRWPHPVCNELAFTVTDRLVEDKIVEKRLQHPWLQIPECVGPWWGWPGHHIPTPYKPEWSRYCGTYRFRISGYELKWYAKVVLALGVGSWTPCIKVHESDGFLCVTESRFFQRFNTLRAFNDRLQEVKPGIFATSGGATLDFTSEIPTWCNWRLNEQTQIT
jgi:CubicO group peptidase (beta-lactamase class C family)